MKRELESLESKLLHEMKRMNGALNKQFSLPAGDRYMECGGFRYDTVYYGCIAGNIGEVMIVVSVGDEFPADIIVKKRMKNSTLAEKGTNKLDSLSSIVPGLQKEAAADLMATASVYMKSSTAVVVQLLLDVPMMQRSKQYYISKIEEFFQNCKQPVGMYLRVSVGMAPMCA